jgi:hypothetical protein
MSPEAQESPEDGKKLEDQESPKDQESREYGRHEKSGGCGETILRYSALKSIKLAFS